MILYRPLEECLTELETLAKEGNRKEFVKKSVDFYVQMGKLEKMGWVIKPSEITRSYQQRYDQMKLLLGLGRDEKI